MHKLPKNLGIYVKILGVKTLTRSKLHTEGPQILCTTVQYLIARATWRSGICATLTYSLRLSIICLATLSVAQPIRIENKETEERWKEEVRAQFKVISRRLLGGPEKNNDSFSQGS